MPALKSLSFATLPKNSSDPIQIRRSRLVERLEEQKVLLADPSLVRTTQRTVKENGEKRIVPHQFKVKPWWRTDDVGRVFMSIKFAGRPVEFEKGKSAVAVPSKDKLSSVIDTLITATNAGELDEALASASKQRPLAKKRAA